MGSVYLTTPFRNLKYILSGVLQERIPWTALVEDRQEQLTLGEHSGEGEEMKETLRGRNGGVQSVKSPREKPPWHLGFLC